MLGGTQEAHHIAAALRREVGLTMTVSLARPERLPKAFAWPVRIGGFGGPGAYRDWLARTGTSAILDATHPFATAMGHRTLELKDELQVEYLRFLRPAWMPSVGDNWRFLNDASEAAEHIPAGSTVFLATGQDDLASYSGLDGCRVLCRVRDKTSRAFPFSKGEFVFQSGPFTVHEECDFLLREKVDWIVSRNTGGQGSWPKIEAARELGLPVAMIRRPPQPEALKINSVAQALSWVRRRLESGG